MGSVALRTGVPTAGRTAYAAKGRRCEGGFLVSAGSMAGLKDKSSLKTSELLIRQNLRDSLALVPSSDT